MARRDILPSSSKKRLGSMDRSVFPGQGGNGEFCLEVQIPFNTMAEVRIPGRCGKLKEVLRNGTVYHGADMDTADADTVLHVGSGAYRLVAVWPMMQETSVS